MQSQCDMWHWPKLICVVRFAIKINARPRAVRRGEKINQVFNITFNVQRSTFNVQPSNPKKVSWIALKKKILFFVISQSVPATVIAMADAWTRITLKFRHNISLFLAYFLVTPAIGSCDLRIGRILLSVVVRIRRDLSTNLNNMHQGDSRTSTRKEVPIFPRHRVILLRRGDRHWFSLSML